MPPPAEERKRVLVVDDEERIRDILRYLLEKAGYEVYTAANGEAGLKAATSAPPDVIILDVMMPEKDGFTVCGEIKRIGRMRDVPVVFLTAKGGERSLRSALHKAAAAFIEKPFKKETVLAVLKEVLASVEEKR